MWLRRAGVALLAVLLFAAGSLAWLRHGWADEQRRLVELRGHDGYDLYNTTQTKAEPLVPWLRKHLPERIGIYLDRVVDLQLYRDDATDRDMQLIGGLGHLRGLMVQGSNVTDSGAAELRGLTEMEDLSLHISHLTDAGVANLEGMQRMKDLQIEGGEMTNAGLDHLHGMPNLRSLTICQNHVNRDGLRRWLKQHPGVQIIDGPGAPLTLDKEEWERAAELPATKPAPVGH